ncbi:MAG TPA: hypothetical protein VHC67_12530 [Gaiellaceae bacterium]|nr:hypothetical protein [Gaiellaceae bacterium]
MIAVALAAGGCDGAGRDLGESCDTTAECGAGLQCLEQVCVPRCHAHVDCGDGAVCDDGECHAVQSAIGDPCYSELACAAGQTCRLAQELHVAPGTCEAEGAGALEGEACTADRDCRQGGCALGRCVSLCDTDDCRRGWTCAEIPLPERSTSVSACLPGNTTIEFELPVPAADPAAPEIFPDLPVPVPSTARSMSLVFEAPTPENTVGASLLKNPRNQVIYREPDLIESYFTNPVRHKPQPGVSVLQVPSSTAAPLLAGIYTVDVHLYRDAPRLPPGERPRVRVVEKLGSAARLDLHFYFLDLAEHPCADRIGTDLSASTAPTLSGFQQLYLAELERIFEAANISLGEVTYDDITALTTANGRPDLDVLDASQAAELFALTTHTSGVSIFFVRSLEPDGPQLLTNDTPGAPIPGTGASGIAIGLDTLCYREWKDLARQTAHGIARHMGLFRNVEPDELPGHVDPIDDSDDSLDNLMNWSEFGGTDLSLGQREILRASPVLR